MDFFFALLLVCGRALPSSAGRLVLDLKSATRLRHTKSHSLPGGDSVPLPFDPARCTSSVMTWGRRALMLSSYRTTRRADLSGRRSISKVSRVFFERRKNRMNGSRKTRVCSTPQYTLGITPAVKIRPSRRLLVGLDLGFNRGKAETLQRLWAISWDSQ